MSRPLPLLATLATLVAATVAAPVLHAQVFTADSTDSAQSAYLALSVTPMGALAPMVGAHEAGLPGRAPGFRAQFASRDDGQGLSRRTFAGGLDLAFGRSTLGLTVGYVDFACDIPDLAGSGLSVDCKGTMMGGVDFTVPVVRHPLAAGDASTLVIGTMLSAGAGRGEVLKLHDDSAFFGGDVTARATAWSAGIQLPIAVVLKSEGVSVVPHVRPGIAYGHAKAEIEQLGFTGSTSDGDVRFFVGGGLGLLFRNAGIGLDLGFHKTFVKDSRTLLGVGLSFTGH